MALQRKVRYVSAAELLKLIRSPGLAIIDVRDEERSYDGHIHGSYHYASQTFEEQLPHLLNDLQNSNNNTIVFHCALSQVRGPKCAKKLLNHLIETQSSWSPQIYVLERGFNGWAGDGHPYCSCQEMKCP